MHHVLLVAVLLLSSACGGGDDDGESTIDGGGPVVLDIRGEGAALLAARQGTDAWQLLTADAQGRVAYPVDRPFELVGACAAETSRVVVIAGGPEDGVGAAPDTFDLGCPKLGDAVITLAAPDASRWTVSIGTAKQYMIGGGSYQMRVSSGRHDVATYSQGGQTLAIRRDVEIVDGMTIAVDLGGSQPLVSRPVIGGPSGAIVRSYSETAGGTMIRFANQDTAGWMMPSTLAVAGDRHVISLREDEAGTPRGRFAGVEVDVNVTTPLSLTLPPALESPTVSWEPFLTATFDPASGPWDEVALEGQLYASETWWRVEALLHADRPDGAFGAPADLGSIPGWDPGWHQVELPHHLFLGLSRVTAGGHEGVSWFVDVPAAP